MNTVEIDLMELMRQDVEAIKRDFNEMKSKVNEMYNELIGSALSKTGGIIKRVESLEMFKAELQMGHDDVKERLGELEVKAKKRDIYLSIFLLLVGSAFTLLIQAIFKK